MNRTFWVVAGLFIGVALIVAGLRTNVGTVLNSFFETVEQLSANMDRSLFISGLE